MTDSKRISGTTWEVYLYILTSNAPGVRDIWRGLSLSSPSLAQYHVNKLLDLGFIQSNPQGKYEVNQEANVEALRSFIILRGKLIPRLVFYGALLTGILIAYILLWPFRWDFRDLVVLAISVFSVTAFFYEAKSQYKGLVQG